MYSVHSLFVSCSALSFAHGVLEGEGPLNGYEVNKILIYI